MTTNRAPSAALSRAMTEDELLTAITEAATFLGWRWAHPRRSDLAVMMGHSGVPDLFLARHGHTAYLELKSETGKLSPDQIAWLAEIAPQRGPDWPARYLTLDGDAAVVRPSDLDYLLDLLR